MIDKQMLCDAINKVEVCVHVFGEKKEFTLNEFLSRLGFDRQRAQSA